jgi:hypothetical protein
MMTIRTAIATCLLLLISGLQIQAQEKPVMLADEVISRLVARDAEREKQGGGYTGRRRYALENQRLNKQAEMLVTVRCDGNGRKHFEVVSENGWKSANNHVLQKLLESEEETSQPEKRFATRVALENYRFELLGTEIVDGRFAYVLRVLPKRQDKYLFEGRIWVDAEDFAMVQAEGRPAKIPSFWTHTIHFVARYHKSGDFWFPLSTESVTEASIFGETNVTIEYFGYSPNSELSERSATHAPVIGLTYLSEGNHAEH